VELGQPFERAPGHEVEVLLHQVLIDQPTRDHPLFPGEPSRSRAKGKDPLAIRALETLRDGISTEGEMVERTGDRYPFERLTAKLKEG
jgi:hypothetical protein